MIWLEGGCQTVGISFTCGEGLLPGGATQGQNSRHADPWVPPAFGESGQIGHSVWQLAAVWAGCCDDDLGAAVEAIARVVEGVHSGTGEEVQVRAGIEPDEQVFEKIRDVVGFERWIILGGDHKQEFCQTELALAQDGTGLGEKFLGFALASVGNIAFTADGKKQRVHTCSIDRMDLAHPCENAWENRCC